MQRKSQDRLVTGLWSLFISGELEPSISFTSAVACALPQPLTSTCLCEKCQLNISSCQCMSTNLERILSREALVAVATWKWLDSQMYPLMSLQIVIAVEALRTLVASEGSVVLWVALLRMAVKML